MKPTQALHEAGQSLWLDNITRALLDEGILARYVDEYSVTGLTSNPTIFDKAIRDGTAYDADIAARKASGASDEEVFFELALADLRRAAELFGPVHARTDTVDGWVSLEVSPMLAHDTPRTVEQAEGPTRGPGRSGCCGPRPRSRTPRPRTCCTWTRWPPCSPSTPCRTTRWRRSPTTG